MPTKSASTAVKLAIAFLCLACVSLASSALAAGSTTSSKYTEESMQAYERQLAGGQIAVARFNEKARAMHLTLKDGRHMRVLYKAGEEPALHAALQARGVTLPVLKKHTIHHTLRYVAAGVLVLVILIVIGVGVVIRRRRREERY